MNPIGGAAGTTLIVPLNFTTPEKMAAPDPVTPVPDPNAPNPAAPKIDPSEAKKQKQAAAASVKPVFRDAIGRIVNREPGRRTEAFIQTALMPSLLALSGIIESKASTNLLAEYCGEFALRSKDWTLDQVEAIAETEFNRAVDALVS
jgi:hypothetical protein